MTHVTFDDVYNVINTLNLKAKQKSSVLNILNDLERRYDNQISLLEEKNSSLQSDLDSTNEEIGKLEDKYYDLHDNTATEICDLKEEINNLNEQLDALKNGTK